MSNLEWGPAGFTPGTGTMVSGVTSPYALTGLALGTAYDFYVQDDCLPYAVSGWAGPASFTTLADPYCASNFTNVTFEHITNVTFAGINNTSAGIIGGPVDYTAQVANVQLGMTYPIDVTILPDASEYIYVWIDWNQNYLLDDAGEEFVVASAVGTAGPHTINIVVPAGATLGNTRMRVMCDWANAVPNPCRSATYGEAEDYTVNVAP